MVDKTQITTPEKNKELPSSEGSDGTQFPSIPPDSPLASELGEKTLATPLPSFSAPLLRKAENPRGTVLILNGCQSQAAHNKLTAKLSNGFLDKGWNTLLLDLPEQDSSGYATAINKSVAHAQIQSDTPITLLGHDCDVPTVLKHALTKPMNISAYIILSLNDETITKQAYNFNAPLLDIHGSIGTNTSVDLAWLKSIEKSGGRRMELPMANDDFQEQEDSLIFLISNWLKTNSK